MSVQNRVTLKSYFNNGDQPSETDFANLIDSMLLVGGDTATGTLVLNADPTNAMEAATKNYVDSLAMGLSWKQSVVAATTGNITLSGNQTIDGVAVVTSDRVLVKDQTTASENGIYVAASGSWSRATDNDTGTEIVSSTLLCKGGTVNAGTQWHCTNSAITVGSTDIIFVLIASAGVYLNGTGLSLSGNVFSIDSSVATLTGTQTLTNKTLTSPKIDLGSDATGDLYYRDSGGNLVKLAVGTSGQVLKGGTVPSYGSVASVLGYTPVNQNGDTMTGLLVLSGDPVSSMGAATKSYVDSFVTGLSWKQSVAAATTGNITLSGNQTIDGVAVVTNDRVLVKDQTTASENGIYVVASGAWSRADDNNSGVEIANTTVLCESGTVNEGTQWNCSNSSITLGSTNIIFVMISGSGGYTNGTGLSLTGNTFSINSSVVTLTGTQTLTNKTLTAPAISSPTGLVKADVGLGNVDNTSDATKNAATVTLTNKTLTAPVINSPTGLVKADVGLSNVDNTSDATKNAATATLTNKTLTSPKINVGSDATGDLYYRDASGNFVRLAVGTSSQVLKGGTTPSYGSVTETMQSLSDITTNNVSTSQHGYAPKLPNDVTKYLDGTGNYSKPEGISMGKSFAISRNSFLL